MPPYDDGGMENDTGESAVAMGPFPPHAKRGEVISGPGGMREVRGTFLTRAAW